MTAPGWQMQSFDLRQGLPALPAVAQQRGLYALFWWGQLPLGHCQIPAAALPLSPAQAGARVAAAIAPAVAAYALPDFRSPLPHDCLPSQFVPTLSDLIAIAQPFDTLPALPERGELSITVVICTRDRPQQVERCLRSLQAAVCPPDQIIVVDNAPQSDATQQRVAALPGVQYVREPQAGLDVARNTGIRHSRSDIIAFTDDDVQIHPYWLAGVRRAFRDDRVQAMTGLVLPLELDTLAQDLFEQYWSFSRGYCPLEFDRDYFQRLKPWGVPSWCLGAGANMAFRRTVLEQVGEFDPRLDVGAAGCSGDSELWYRILAAGYTCRYEPTAVVFHQHRQDLESLKYQLFYYMRGHVAALLIQFEKTRHGGNLRRLFWALPRYYAGLLRQRYCRGYEPRHCTLFREIQGCLSGVCFYLRVRFVSILISLVNTVS